MAITIVAFSNRLIALLRTLYRLRLRTIFPRATFYLVVAFVFSNFDQVIALVALLRMRRRIYLLAFTCRYVFVEVAVVSIVSIVVMVVNVWIRHTDDFFLALETMIRK